MKTMRPAMLFWIACILAFGGVERELAHRERLTKLEENLRRGAIYTEYVRMGSHSRGRAR